MTAFLEHFHFLRPWLLSLLFPALGLIGYALRQQRRLRGAETLIAPHLLRHLQVGQAQRHRLRPLHLLAGFWITGILALAGPAWEKAASPFTADEAGLVIALKVTPDMLGQDIQPSRLQRATQKVLDLLERRPGNRTALLAYSGTSHLVMPFTTDPRVISMFIRALDPDIMPNEGDHPVAALQQAASLLEQARIPGSILLIADAVPREALSGLRQFHARHPVPVLLYAVAAPRGVPVPPGSPPAPALDPAALKQAAKALDADLIPIKADDGDVRQLARRIRTRMQASSPQLQEGQRWRDDGYWLLPLLLVIALPFFRRGWGLS